MAKACEVQAGTTTGLDPTLSRRVIANTLFNFAAQLYVVILALAVVPYVVHHLGAELYGVLAVVAAIGLGGTLNLGLGRALAKYVAERGASEGSRNLFQTALAMALPGSVGGCLLIIGFRKPIAAIFFHGHTIRPRDVSFAALVAGLALGISLLSDCFSALLVGLQRYDIYNVVYVVQSTLKNLGAVLVLALGLLLRAVLLIYLVASVVSLCGHAYYARKLIPQLSFRPRFRWLDFKLLTSFAAAALLASLGSLTIQRLDRLVLAYYLPISAVAFYVIPNLLAERIGVMVGNITTALFPASSELHATGAGEKVQSLYISGTKMATLVALPVALPLIIFPSDILRLWVGRNFAAQGSLPLQILASGFLVFVLAYVPNTVTQGIGRPWLSTSFRALDGALTIGLMIALIPRHGIVGASVGFSLAQWVVTPLFIWKVNRITGVSWQSLLKQGYLRPLLCAAGTLGFLWTLRPYVDSLPGLVVCAGVGFVIYTSAAFLIALDSKERARIFQQVRSILHLRGQAAGA